MALVAVADGGSMNLSPRREPITRPVEVLSPAQEADMKTLHLAYRVRDLARSTDFYEKVGYREIGRVAFADGSVLLMLNLPGDGEVVTLELVYDPRLDPLEIGDDFSHLAVQVDDLAATLADLPRKGID